MFGSATLRFRWVWPVARGGQDWISNASRTCVVYRALPSRKKCSLVTASSSGHWVRLWSMGLLVCAASKGVAGARGHQRAESFAPRTPSTRRSGMQLGRVSFAQCIVPSLTASPWGRSEEVRTGRGWAQKRSVVAQHRRGPSTLRHAQHRALAVVSASFLRPCPTRRVAESSPPRHVAYSDPAPPRAPAASYSPSPKDPRYNRCMSIVSR